MISVANCSDFVWPVGLSSDSQTEWLLWSTLASFPDSHTTTFNHLHAVILFQDSCALDLPRQSWDRTKLHFVRWQCVQACNIGGDKNFMGGSIFFRSFSSSDMCFPGENVSLDTDTCSPNKYYEGQEFPLVKTLVMCFHLWSLHLHDLFDIDSISRIEEDQYQVFNMKKVDKAVKSYSVIKHMNCPPLHNIVIKDRLELSYSPLSLMTLKDTKLLRSGNRYH